MWRVGGWPCVAALEGGETTPVELTSRVGDCRYMSGSDPKSDFLRGVRQCTGSLRLPGYGLHEQTLLNAHAIKKDRECVRNRGLYEWRGQLNGRAYPSNGIGRRVGNECCSLRPVRTSPNLDRCQLQRTPWLLRARVPLRQRAVLPRLALSSRRRIAARVAGRVRAKACVRSPGAAAQARASARRSWAA